MAGTECLRRVKIVASCKYIVSSDIANIAVSKGSKDAPSPGYIFKKVGAYEETTRGIVANIYKHIGYFRKRITNHRIDLSLGWPHGEVSKYYRVRSIAIRR